MVTRPIQPPAVAGLPDHVLAAGLALAGEPRWRESVLYHLTPIRRTFVEHVRRTEGPTGFYAEVLAQAPRLHHGVRLLTREHAAIVAALAELQRAADRPSVGPAELSRRVDELLRALARHRQRGADLLWQAYQTDLGGESGR
ncbi:hemerythrin domain-containing protein [Micromonospora sp. NPDC000089]|uniref:hemerythrin domain-containing protein n=1 Tax=unclassified Micromonospora TaxID=2617518 RepID=UPI0036C9E725